MSQYSDPFLLTPPHWNFVWISPALFPFIWASPVSEIFHAGGNSFLFWNSLHLTWWFCAYLLGSGWVIKLTPSAFPRGWILSPVVPHHLVVLTDAAVSTTILSVYLPRVSLSSLSGFLSLIFCHHSPGSLQCSIGFLILVYLSDSRIPKILPHWVAGLSSPLGLS